MTHGSTTAVEVCPTCPASLSAKGTSMMYSFTVGFCSFLAALMYSRPTYPM